MKVKRLTQTAMLPTRGSEMAAGWDLYADIVGLEKFVYLNPHETRLVSTGLMMEIPEGYFGGIFARSGLSTKEGLRPANCVGVIDSDYRGIVMVSVHNDSELERTIRHGDRIAQLIVIPYSTHDIEEVDQLDQTERGADGFGSTGR